MSFSALLLYKHNYRQIDETTPPPPFPQINVEVHQMLIFKADLWEKGEQGLDQFCLNIYVHDGSFTINKELSIHLLSFTLVSMKQEN